jgi:DNA polymerase
LATQGRKQVVFGHGNSNATLMFVGEGPGRDEDQQGYPFVGRAGKLLTQIIEAMGLKREDVYISNVVKCRPPENRAPLPIESGTCKNLILFREIDIIQPKVICALGATALQALLGEDARLARYRGIFTEFRGFLLLPTYHPAYLLRNPVEKRTVWEDMKKIMAKLKELEKSA